MSDQKSNKTSQVVFESVHLVLEPPSYRSWSLRARFVQLFKNPISFFKTETNKHALLKGVNFSAKEGERIGIIGKNGAGKTTFCRLITGQVSPTQGRVLVHSPVTGVFDATVGIYPELTGRENAALLLQYLLPGDPRKHPEILDRALEFSNLGDWSDRPIRLYSNGMKARLSLSLLTELPSEILILDEVFEGADEEFQEKIRKRMKSFIFRAKLFFLVSHSREQILSVCNRVLLIHNGQLAFDGGPKAAFRAYDEILEKCSHEE